MFGDTYWQLTDRHKIAPCALQTFLSIEIVPNTNDIYVLGESTSQGNIVIIQPTQNLYGEENWMYVVRAQGFYLSSLLYVMCKSTHVMAYLQLSTLLV